MKIEGLDAGFTVCQVANGCEIDWSDTWCFVSRTDEELSLVCRTEKTPEATLNREDGWRGFRVCGILDFSLVGVMARISGTLAEAGIGLFAVSTYNTDYIFVKEEQFERAMSLMKAL